MSPLQHKTLGYQRIDNIDQLCCGDEIIFLRKPSRRRRAYCAYTASIGPDLPRKMRRGAHANG